jgi:hypothetical protein
LDVGRWPERWPVPHRVVTLNLNDPDLGKLDTDNTWWPDRLPLIYAYRVSGCRIKYEWLSSGDLQLVEREGHPDQRDWPYRDYPVMFPTAPLVALPPQHIPWRQLEWDEDWFGLTWQDSRPSESEMLLVVPPNDAYGVSLWGQSGDLERVQTIFRINLRDRIVEAWNECT